jgi:hypothetical protein
MLSLIIATTAMPQGAVQDADSAVKIAEQALMRIYGKRKIQSERPFRAKLENGVWTVAGTLHCRDQNGEPTEHCVGGVAVAKISEADGRVLSTAHYK